MQNYYYIAKLTYHSLAIAQILGIAQNIIPISFIINHKNI